MIASTMRKFDVKQSPLRFHKQVVLLHMADVDINILQCVSAFHVSRSSDSVAGISCCTISQ